MIFITKSREFVELRIFVEFYEYSIESKWTNRIYQNSIRFGPFGALVARQSQDGLQHMALQIRWLSISVLVRSEAARLWEERELGQGNTFKS